MLCSFTWGLYFLLPKHKISGRSRKKTQVQRATSVNCLIHFVLWSSLIANPLPSYVRCEEANIADSLVTHLHNGLYSKWPTEGKLETDSSLITSTLRIQILIKKEHWPSRESVSHKGFQITLLHYMTTNI